MATNTGSNWLAVSSGLLDPKHYAKMRNALWEFLWLINRVTEEVKREDGTVIGRVLGGQPITAQRIAREIGESVYSARDHLAVLEAEGYISRINQPESSGYAYVVMNSKKWTHRNGNQQWPLGEISYGGERNLSGGLGETSKGPLEKSPTPLGEITNPNKEEIQETHKTISRTAPPAEEQVLVVVWNYYIQVIGKNPKTYEFTRSRKNKGLLRLKDCLRKTCGDTDGAVGLMKAAIDGLAASDWHMGRDPESGGKKYCDWIDNLFKSYEQMEKWWNQ